MIKVKYQKKYLSGRRKSLENNQLLLLPVLSNYSFSRLTMSAPTPNIPQESKKEVTPSKIVADLSSGILSSCEVELQSVSKELKDFT